MKARNTEPRDKEEEIVKRNGETEVRKVEDIQEIQTKSMKKPITNSKSNQN